MDKEPDRLQSMGLKELDKTEVTEQHHLKCTVFETWDTLVLKLNK